MSVHAAYCFDDEGKRAGGPEPPFPTLCDAVPGVELRILLLFSEGVGKARISLQRFVAVCCEAPARLFGLYPKKGTIAPGSDADLAIWNPDQVVDVRWADLHDQVGYSPYEGRQIKGFPETVLRRGEVVVRDGQPRAQPGSGRFIVRDRPNSAEPLYRPSWSVALARRFGAVDFLK